jgi:peptidyl-prolyl cis-trans isomerase D
MLKLLRKGAIERPWFYRTIMFVIAAAFVITMGWWGLGPSSKPYVAQIDDVRISREEYRRTYENISRFYRNLVTEGLKEETLKKIAVESLVERQLWLKAADQMDLTVTLPELSRALMETTAFHKKGRFDPDQYRIVLANSRPRLTPEQYENALREDLLLEKVKSVIRDGVVLTEQEQSEAKARISDPKLSPEKRAEEEAKAVQNAFMQKKERALVSFLQSVRASTRIEVDELLL